MTIEITETEIFADNLTKKQYDRLNRVASKVAKQYNAVRETEKERIQGAWVYSSSYETELHRGYCFQVGHPMGDGKNIHAHDEFYTPILEELEKMGLHKEEK